MRLAEGAPDFAAELEAGLRLAECPELAAQVAGLEATSRCGCGDDSFFSFYTGAQPDGPWGDGHETVPLLLEMRSGTVCVDTVHSEIRFVEALDRTDLASFVADVAPRESPGQRH